MSNKTGLFGGRGLSGVRGVRGIQYTRRIISFEPSRSVRAPILLRETAFITGTSKARPYEALGFYDL